MDVNGINTASTSASPYTAPANNATNSTANNASEAVVAQTEEKSQNQQSNEAAIYEASGKKKAVYKPDANKIKQMWADNERQVSAFRKLVEGLFNKQAGKANIAEDWLQNKPWNPEEMIEIDDETRAAAKKETEEGGYYSVEETAKRILDFAVALSGGDPNKISELKDATLKGFKAAEKAWGGELPEISQKTYDAVVKGFEEWEAAGSSSAITLLSKTS